MKIEVLRLIGAADPELLLETLRAEPRKAERARALAGLLDFFHVTDLRFSRLLAASRLPLADLKKILADHGYPVGLALAAGLTKRRVRRMGLPNT